MITYIYYVLIALNLFFLIIKRKPKLLFIVNFVFAFILFYGNTKTGDYENYFYAYKHSLDRNMFEIGFSMMMRFFKQLGLAYNEFVGIVWLIGGSIYIYIFSRYSKNYPAFFLMYYVYIIFMDINQVRSFLATAIVCMSLHCYFNRRKVISIFWLIISISIHTESIFFAPLILFINPNTKLPVKLLKKCSIIIIAICIINVVLNSQNNSFVQMLGKYAFNIMGLDEKTGGYLSTKTNLGGIFYSMLHVFIIIIFAFMQKILLRNPDKNLLENEQNTYNKIYLLQLFCVISFPLIMINMNFYRLYKMMFLFNAILYAMILDSYNTTFKNYYKCLFLGMLTVLVYRIPIVQGNEQIEIILNNNIFLEK